ncbi:hypothetical protein [Flavonifractor sp. An100]|uniref:hypothetical protein n=1 Tax=Flavonifractor sp. An100 TaxID=1965538 RepID=UPI001302A6E8|nr:hypothetical protein [Flavonifractor sp. An100]
MKTVLFGIAVILFAMLMMLSDVWLPGISDLMSRGESALLVGAVGLVIAGIGAFRKDK